MTFSQSLGRRLKSQIPELKGHKIVIFGDVGVDEYVQGEVARISPEAPVPVVEVSGTQKKLGLAANVAANIRSLGGEPQLFSLVGEDRGQEILIELLERNEVSSQFLMVEPGRSTTHKLRVMSGHHHIVRVDYESKKQVSESLMESYLPQLTQAIENCDCVIIQDYAKGLINQKSAQQVIQIAQKHQKPVVVDPYRSTPLNVYHGCDFMTPNRDEALELAKQISQPEIWNDITKIGQAFMGRLKAPRMVITLGAQGMQVFDGDEHFAIPTFAKSVFDVTGAGDTVIAAFAMARAAGWDMQLSALMANLAAGVVVGQVGAVACSQSELMLALDQALA
jgi:D-glycero-beta-D-manno-heptose-7-phosphate kinase